MTSDYDPAQYPLEASPEVVADLMHRRGISTRALTAYALSIGAQPPDDRDRWKLSYVSFPEESGREPGLFWQNGYDEQAAYPAEYEPRLPRT
ncbi:hypothetical protein [Longispora albida]|uniref:hypothetical protein n=1 Tax=Longispora albida TaxID=203523 RepID=UPI00036B46CF|nr:hypothetical protein [Longispora albida]